MVALRKESVDRNTFTSYTIDNESRSLSARRAWIEIGCAALPSMGCESLSARRAWIEIVSFRGHGFCPRVALRKESVDRNNKAVKQLAKDNGSLSARRAWIEI